MPGLLAGLDVCIDTHLYRHLSIHRGSIRRVTSPQTDSELLSAIADPTRLRILRQLTDVGACCACDIADNCPVSQPTVSHHLRLLARAGLVRSRRDGAHVVYRLTSDRVAELWAAVRDVAARNDRWARRVGGFLASRFVSDLRERRRRENSG